MEQGLKELGPQVHHIGWRNSGRKSLPQPPNNPAFILGQGNSVVEFLHENTFYTDSKYHGEGEINQEAAAEQFLRRK